HRPTSRRNQPAPMLKQKQLTRPKTFSSSPSLSDLHPAPYAPAGRMSMNKKTNADLPIISFESARDLEKWLQKNHSTSPGIWLRFFKKDSGKKIRLPQLQ